MTKNSLVTMITTILILNSCNWHSDCDQVPLSKKSVEWFNCYKLNDTIVFKSNLNNYDTLVVTTKESEYSPCNKFELGPDQYESMVIVLESICVRADDCRAQLIKDNFVMLRSSNQYRESNRWIDVYNLESENLECESEKPDSTINCDNVTQLKVPSFKDSIEVYRFNHENAHSRYPYVNSKYPCAVKTFHWSKQHGLVQYVTESNEVYNLTKTNR